MEATPKVEFQPSVSPLNIVPEVLTWKISFTKGKCINVERKKKASVYVTFVLCCVALSS